MTPAGIDPGPLTAEQLRNLADDFAATARMLRRHLDTLAEVAAVFGMPAPTSLPKAIELGELTSVARAASRPEERWLRDEGRAAAWRAVEELEPKLAALASAEAAAGEVFGKDVLDTPGLADLARRFAEEHHGLHRVTAAYRTDKRLVAGLTLAGQCDKATIARLPQAVAWQEADAALRSAVTAHSAALGGYWNGRDTDFAAVRSALEAAQRISELTTDAIDRTALTGQVTRRTTA